MNKELDRPWRDYTFVAFDTETSGKFPLVAEIVEVAAVKWQGGKIIDSLQTLVKPKGLIREEVIAIHHITNEMVADAPQMAEVLPQFDSFIKGAIHLAHNAQYDLGFMAYEYEKLGMPLPKEMTLDSCRLAQVAFPESENHRLATLIGHLGIKVSAAHRALDDSKACLEVALQSMEKINKEGTLDNIVKTQGDGVFYWGSFSRKDLLTHEIYGPIIEGCEKSLVVEFTYKGGTVSKQPRRMTPQGFVKNPRGPYVVGLCHIDNIEKRFYLNRILSAKIVD